MSFFDEVPDPEPEEPARYIEPDWRRVPHEVVPFPLPISELVHRSPEVALVVHSVSVYPNGLTFMLVATLHPEAAAPEIPMHEVLLGGAWRHQTRLRIGVLHEDGTRATHPEAMAGPGPTGPAASITARGGGGMPDCATAAFYVWPLPRAGDLTLLFRWAAVGLDEGRVVLPGDALRAGAARATEIWPGAQVPRPTMELGEPD